MKRLTKLANKHKTDKGTEFSYAHGFTEFYEPFFEKYENPTILELGVDKGASEKMLNDFYDGNCTIYCVDIEDKSDLFKDYDNIKFFQCDLSTRENISELISRLESVSFDIIIDDASHKWADQFLSLSMVSPLLKEDGVYILEDLHTSYESEIFGEGEDFVQSPLYFLVYLNFNKFLAEEEYYGLRYRIKDINIINLDGGCWNRNSRSITSIITFKK